MHRVPRGERGQSLVIVLSLITIMFLLGSSLAVHSSVALRSTRASEGQGDEFYAADAATELGIWWQRNGKAGNPPAQTINGVTTSTTITSVGGGGGSCTGDPRPTWLTGFENGVLIRNSGTINNLSGGFSFVNSGGSFGIVDVVSSPARTGSYSLRVAPAGGANYAYLESPVGGVALGPNVVAHVAVRLSTVPTGDVSLFTIGLSGSTGLAHPALYLYYKASSGKWALGLGSINITVFQESNVPVALNTWYSFDLRFPVASTNVRTGDWYIDGVAQPSVTFTDNASYTVGAPRLAFGNYSLSPPTYGLPYTAYFDDVEFSATMADFPLGPLNVVPLLPNGMGTHNTPANYQNDNSTALDANSYQRVDEQPMTVLTDYIKQITAGGGSYAEIAFQNTAETCIRGASIVAGLHTPSTSGNNVAINTVANGVNNTVWSGDPSNTTLFYLQRPVSQNTITVGVGPWTQAVINGTVARFGFSTDVNPNPYLDGIILETAYHPLTGGPATITIVGTGGGSTITTDYVDAGAGIPTLDTWTTTK